MGVDELRVNLKTGANFDSRTAMSRISVEFWLFNNDSIYSNWDNYVNVGTVSA